MSRKRSMPIAAAFAAALLLVGCGLKQGAVDSIKQNPGAGGGDVGSGGAPGAVAGGGSSTGPGGTAIGPGGSVAGGGGASGSGTNGAGGTGTSQSGTNSAGGTTTITGNSNAPYQRIGISSTTIRLGLHAPQTGAAPIPLQAFKTGTKLYWENHTVFGHKVAVDFLDDQYRPDVAVQACNTLSRKDFLVIGGAGSDQIQACGTDQTLIKSHTPYLSEGVTTNGLTNVPSYFAVSQTYAQQAPEVYANAVKQFPSDAGGKWGIVTYKGPNFDDVTNAMVSVLEAHGKRPNRDFKVFRPDRPGDNQSANTQVDQLRSFGAKTVFLTVSPNFWLDMVGYASSRYTPAWVGPGVTMGENLVASVACPAQPTIKASFLSPFYALDHQPSGFSGESNPSPDSTASSRDIELDIYAVSEVIYHAMLSVGTIQNLTRDNFINAMTHFHATYGQQLTVYPTVSFSGGSHFGGTGAWSEKLVCGTKQQYVTASWPHYLTP
jgi:branched-chain amino acid transport system substrate-binding protein